MKNPYLLLFSALCTCEISALHQATAALAERLRTDFLPPYDRERLLLLGLSVCDLRKTNPNKTRFAEFAKVLMDYLSKKSVSSAVDTLLSLRAVQPFAAPCDRLLSLIFCDL